MASKWDKFEWQKYEEYHYKWLQSLVKRVRLAIMFLTQALEIIEEDLKKVEKRSKEK